MNKHVGLVLLVLLAPLPAEAGVEAALHDALKGCDRIRVRTGGTCHRRPDDERTLFEVRDQEEIRATILSIRIDDKRSGGHCMCCGEPTFEFYRGKKLITMVGFHHSRSIRWAGGPWWGDGLLTPESAEALCRWLDRHGYKEALEDHRANLARERSQEIRRERYERLLGKKTWSRVEKAFSRDQQTAMLRNVDVGGDNARALLYFKLLGCHEGAWDHVGGLDSPLIHKLIPELPAIARDHALRAASKDPYAANGAARWLFGERNFDRVSTELLAEVSPALGRSGLAHPRAASRRQTLIALRKIEGEASVALLRAVLAGKIKPRELPEDEDAEPSGLVVRRGEATAIRGVEDERAVAAYFLAELGDQDSRAAIQELASAQLGPTRTLLDAALKLLDDEATR